MIESRELHMNEESVVTGEFLRDKSITCNNVSRNWKDFFSVGIFGILTTLTNFVFQ